MGTGHRRPQHLRRACPTFAFKWRSSPAATTAATNSIPTKAAGCSRFASITASASGRRLRRAAASRPACSPAQSAAISAIPGAVFSGSEDGHLRAYSTANGKIIWDYDTAHEYKTVNGVPGHGGAIDVAGPVVAGGMLFAVSGYPARGGMPGNVLLAFSVEH